MASLSSPILFIIFNRPDSTERVFQAIRRHRPSRLYIAADGPRLDKENERKLVEETRTIACKVDWPCELKTLFRSENLGCGKAVSEAISWFFENEEEGIILEDDCLPHQDFFAFCDTLLARYRDDPRVLTISGDHFLPHRLHIAQPYYFSKYVQIWGWATWRRTWRQYDLHLGQRKAEDWEALIDQVNPTKAEANYWKHIFRSVFAGGVDTWDFQLMFTCWHLGGMHICPCRNLISNIGYGPDATHTNFNGSLAKLPVAPLALGETLPPVETDKAIDSLIFYTRFLESMCQTWWVEQVFEPSGKLEWARLDAMKAKEEFKRSERRNKAIERQNRLLSEKLIRLEEQKTKKAEILEAKVHT